MLPGQERAVSLFSCSFKNLFVCFSLQRRNGAATENILIILEFYSRCTAPNLLNVCFHILVKFPKYYS